MCDVNEKGLQKKFIVPLVVSELAPAESSEPERERESSASRLGLARTGSSAPLRERCRVPV